MSSRLLTETDIIYFPFILYLSFLNEELKSVFNLFGNANLGFSKMATLFVDLLPFIFSFTCIYAVVFVGLCIQLPHFVLHGFCVLWHLLNSTLNLHRISL